METESLKINIDGKEYEVKPGNNLLQTCLALGFDIPYFCFHPAMGSVGACRQCAVKKFANAEDKRGKIVMSCMEPVTEGLIISTTDPEVKAFRAAVIESLMTNHPHDCPICDEGGECHLQDMTVMTGHAYRRFEFRKRTYNNQYLGPFIHHEMNRCIQCYRCVRFYRDYAGGNDFDVMGSANRVYFGRFQEGTLESEFSGNLVEVCPTGVFTDKPLKDHYTRKWDLTNAPSVCIHCSLGCNTIIGERYGTVRRVLSRYNGEVNGYFLCDRGRFGYDFLNSQGRIKKIMAKVEGQEEPGGINEEEYRALAGKMLNNRKLAGIGSPRASLEANFALETLVGTKNFFHGISGEQFRLVDAALKILNSTTVHSPSLKEIEKHDAILILGEDLTNTAPMLALAVRQALRNKSFEKASAAGIPLWNDAPVRDLAQATRSPLFIASPCSTKLDDVAEGIFRAAPAEISRLGFTIASLIDRSAPGPEKTSGTMIKTAKTIASSLINAENPLIITGLQSNDILLLNSVANIARALSNAGKIASVSMVFPEANSAGLGLMAGKALDGLKAAALNGEIDTLIILENDLYRRTAREEVDSIIDSCKNIIVLDYLENETTMKAGLLLPSGTFAESTGTIVSNEGRAQRYYRVLPEEGMIRENWKILSEFIEIAARGNDKKWQGFDDIVNSFTETYPLFNKVIDEMPDSGFRLISEKVARQSARFSGRTAMNAAREVSEPRPPQDEDSPLTFSMEGFKGVSPSSYLVPYYWAPGWNSVQAMNKYTDEPGGSYISGDPGVLLFNGTTGPVQDFFKEIPGPFIPEKGKLLIVPVSLIFGSEELSSESKPVSELIPEPFLLINKDDVSTLTLTEDNYTNITINQINIKLKVRIDYSIPAGIAGLSYMLPGMPYVKLPYLCGIEKAGIQEKKEK